MIDPNKHGVFNQDKKITPNWGLIGILLACAYYWVNVYYYGFFVTTMWTIVIAAIIALWLKLTDRI